VTTQFKNQRALPSSLYPCHSYKAFLLGDEILIIHLNCFQPTGQLNVFKKYDFQFKNIFNMTFLADCEWGLTLHKEIRFSVLDNLVYIFLTSFSLRLTVNFSSRWRHSIVRNICFNGNNKKSYVDNVSSDLLVKTARPKRVAQLTKSLLRLNYLMWENFCAAFITATNFKEIGRWHINKNPPSYICWKISKLSWNSVMN